MRLYEPVWLLLKRDRRIDLSVHPVYVRRVKKAVSKEKDEDLLVKYKSRDHGENFTLEFSYSLERRILTIILTQRLNIEDINLTSTGVVDAL